MSDKTYIPELQFLIDSLGSIYQDKNNNPIVYYHTRIDTVRTGINIFMNEMTPPYYPDEHTLSVIMIVLNFTDNEYKKLFSYLSTGDAGYVSDLTCVLYPDPRIAGVQIAEYNFNLSTQGELPDGVIIDPDSLPATRVIVDLYTNDPTKRYQPDQITVDSTNA